MGRERAAVAKPPKSNWMGYIVLRYMRRPIMFLIAVYATSMTGWILIPGVDEQGNEQYLSLFHAFYFLTYTVTTTGFGELPATFTDGQRMWSILSLYAGVIAWFYALGSIVGLVQNQDFRQSVAERRFAKTVARIDEPFYIVCGFGNTGALLTRGLTDAGITVVVIDLRPERVRTVMLRDYRAPVAALCADAGTPEHLIEGGLLNEHCKAVVALTPDEDANLKISVTARLLNPDIQVITQSTSQAHVDTLATLGDSVHIIDPFQTYAKYLGATIANPAVHTLNQWLAGTPGATLDQSMRPPKGNWILCGYGRMGHWLREALEAEGISTVVIEPDPRPEDEDLPNLIVGRATQETLLRAGIEQAAGIVAGTNNDSDNMSILLNARALNPELFFVVRQNRFRNQVVFQAADVDVIMTPGLVSSRRILFILIAPLMRSFFEALRERDQRAGGGVLVETVAALDATVGGSQPRVWTVDVGAAESAAVVRLAEAGRRVTLGDLMRDPAERSQRLDCVALMLNSDGSVQILPEPATPVRPGDQILFCGSPRAARLLDASMNNEYTLAYLMTGLDEPRGYAMKWLNRKLAAPQPAE